MKRDERKDVFFFFWNCHSAALNALFVGQKDWFLIPPHRTTLSGMAAEKFWSSLFITS